MNIETKTETKVTQHVTLDREDLMKILRDHGHLPASVADKEVNYWITSEKLQRCVNIDDVVVNISWSVDSDCASEAAVPLHDNVVEANPFTLRPFNDGCWVLDHSMYGQLYLWNGPYRDDPNEVTWLESVRECLDAPAMLMAMCEEHGLL